MTEYLQFHGKKDQKWHDTLAALQAIDNKDIMDSERVDKWLRKSGASNQLIEYIKFNKPQNEPVIYKKMDKRLLESTDAQWIFQEVADHISSLFDNKEDYIYGVEKIIDAPQCVKNIHYLWLFSCEVGSGGLSSYIINDSGFDLELLLTHKALKAINANDIVERFESCIVLGLKDNNLAMYHGSVNFKGMKIFEIYNDFEKIDDNIYEIISTPFSQQVVSYIKEHRNEIFEFT